MSFFGEDPVDELVRNFFGGNQVRRIQQEEFISGEQEDRNIDFVESKNNIFVIFELAGYSKEDIEVNIKGSKLKIIASKKSSDYIKSYLTKRFNDGVTIRKVLPKMINTKNFNYTFKNGVLELVFKK